MSAVYLGLSSVGPSFFYYFSTFQAFFIHIKWLGTIISSDLLSLSLTGVHCTNQDSNSCGGHEYFRERGTFLQNFSVKPGTWNMDLGCKGTGCLGEYLNLNIKSRRMRCAEYVARMDKICIQHFGCKT
jgi:hypothetical protein